jgi:hypothetical protein
MRTAHPIVFGYRVGLARAWNERDAAPAPAPAGRASAVQPPVDPDNRAPRRSRDRPLAATKGE